jgi:hypothetical protein
VLSPNKIPLGWIRKYQKGRYHSIPIENFSALDKAAGSLFASKIKRHPIDLYVYNVDTADLVFGRANLAEGYPRELAHHVGLAQRYLKIPPGPREEKFNQGSLDIAIDHEKREVNFKHLTLGLKDMIFPEELEWVTHIGSLQELAMEALREIGMPLEYKKSVVKAAEWARIRTGLMGGKEIPYEVWKRRLKGKTR